MAYLCATTFLQHVLVKKWRQFCPVVLGVGCVTIFVRSILFDRIRGLIKKFFSNEIRNEFDLKSSLLYSTDSCKCLSMASNQLPRLDCKPYRSLGFTYAYVVWLSPLISCVVPNRTRIELDGNHNERMNGEAAVSRRYLGAKSIWPPCHLPVTPY